MSAPILSASVAEIAARVPEAPPGIGPSREAIAEAVALIAERFRPERIVLFGSRAYGVPTADSDVDLMVVMETPLPPLDQAWQIRKAVTAWHDLRLHPTVRTPAQIGLGLAERDFFIIDAVARGVTLFKADGATAGDACVVDGSARRKQTTDAYVAKAESDYRGAAILRAAPEPEFGLVCFLSQQCVEKYLKALLQEREIRFPRIHELEPLAARAVSNLPALAKKHGDLAWLSAYAVDIRYPGAEAGATEADQALHLATDVRRLVRGELGLDETRT
jgi:HEPN domain-containing protein/predicted nucleotidyltransferase